MRALDSGVALHASPGHLAAFGPRSRSVWSRADECCESRQERDMLVLDSDPVARTPGQYARATVRRLRLRTLVTLGVLAVATALLGRTFGLHNFWFLASEIALLASMFV